MTRNEINSQLALRGIRKTDIARKERCTSQLVSMVVSRKRKNPKVRRAISKSIGFPVTVVFPDERQAA